MYRARPFARQHIGEPQCPCHLNSAADRFLAERREYPFRFEDLPLENGKRIEPEDWGPRYSKPVKAGKFGCAANRQLTRQSGQPFDFDAKKHRAKLKAEFAAQANADKRTWAADNSKASNTRLAQPRPNTSRANHITYSAPANENSPHDRGRAPIRGRYDRSRICLSGRRKPAAPFARVDTAHIVPRFRARGSAPSASERAAATSRRPFRLTATRGRPSTFDLRPRGRRLRQQVALLARQF